MPLADPVLVLADEADDDVVPTQQATRELLDLARRIGTPITVRSGHDRAVDELTEIACGHSSRAILIASSPGNDRIAARVAVRLESAILTDVTGLSLEGDHLIAVSDRVRTIVLTRTAVITVRRRIRERRFPRVPPLTEADVVVAGGRGAGSAEGFGLLARVAAALGGCLGGTHTAGELGWCPGHARISLPGAQIRPRLYLAGGASGSVRHRSAIRGARTVVAIDSDPCAPILDEADFGIVGDLHRVLPALLDELAARTRHGSPADSRPDLAGSIPVPAVPGPDPTPPSPSPELAEA